jgi:transcriptional regulator with XRE-family HTH domain
MVLKRGILLKKDKIIYIGPTLKRLRKKYSKTQIQVANDGKINRGHVTDLEGDHKNPSIDMIFQLAKGIGIEPEDLVREIKLDNLDYHSKIEMLKEKE